jgi:phage gp36-like protein
MAYAVQADLSPRRLTNSELIQLTDDTNSGAVNAQIVTDCLTEASATIDSYCRQRYQIPLQQSDQVKGLCLDITEYLLFSRRRKMPDTVKQRYQDAINFLKDVGAGKAGLDQPAAAQPQTAATPGVVSTQIPDRFSDNNLQGWIPSDS